MTKYEIIKQEIKEQIKDNILKPNQVIKSENEMCQCYKVSRVTVRKAIDELCAEGILYRIKGKGCFVRELADQKRSRIYSFTEAVRNEGKLPELIASNAGILCRFLYRQITFLPNWYFRFTFLVFIIHKHPPYFREITL